MQKKIGFRVHIILLFFIIFLANSCVPINKLRYLNDIDERQEPSVNPKGQKLIVPFDKLYIKVFSIDDKTNMLFSSSSNLASSASVNIVGYLVAEDGTINFPFIGKINLNGLNLEQASEKLGKSLNEYVSNATVEIKFIDNNITVFGEVQRPGTYPFNQQKLNIYEALALGGGISQFGDHKKVILIRQEGDKIMHHKLDLSNSRISEKDYYYILNNDVIIVEPLNSASWFRFNSSNYSTILSSITFLITIFFIFKN